MKPTLKKTSSSKPVLKLKPKLRLVSSKEKKPDPWTEPLVKTKEEHKKVDQARVEAIAELLGPLAIPAQLTQPRLSNGRFGKKVAVEKLKQEAGEVQRQETETAPAALAEEGTKQENPQQQSALFEANSETGEVTRWVSEKDLNDPRPGGIVRVYDEPGGRIAMSTTDTAVLPTVGKVESWQDQAMTLITDCEHRESKLNDWERIFLDTIKALVVNGVMLSKKQDQKLNELWERATERG